MQKKFRNICFTLNNYTIENYERITKKFSDLCNYIVIGKEIGKESKLPHLQGYAELSKQTRFGTIKKWLNNAHIEARKGTPKQASDYCKKDGDFIEIGKISNQGGRTDLKEFVSEVRNGKLNHDLIDSHTNIMCRYHKFANQIRTAKCEKMAIENHQKGIVSEVIWGKPGSGKTRSIYDLYDEKDVYAPDLSTSNLWWDGYTGQKILLLDDFYGQIKYSYMLRLLDRYKIQLQIKGGFTYKAWEKVFITSNDPPELWYPNILKKSALKRRISKVSQK